MGRLEEIRELLEGELPKEEDGRLAGAPFARMLKVKGGGTAAKATASQIKQSAPHLSRQLHILRGAAAKDLTETTGLVSPNTTKRGVFGSASGRVSAAHEAIHREITAAAGGDPLRKQAILSTALDEVDPEVRDAVESYLRSQKKEYSQEEMDDEILSHLAHFWYKKDAKRSGDLPALDPDTEAAARKSYVKAIKRLNSLTEGEVRQRAEELRRRGEEDLQGLFSEDSKAAGVE